MSNVELQLDLFEGQILTTEQENTVREFIDSKEKAELRSGARIIGNISCQKLSVAEDSFFDGKIKMDESQEQPYTFVTKRKNEK